MASRWSTRTGLKRCRGLIGLVLALLVLADFSPAVAADLAPPAPERSLLAPQADPFLAFCGGRCAFTVFAGQRLETPATAVFGARGNFVAPYNYEYGNSGIVGIALSKTVYSWNPYLDFDAEIGYGQRYGSLQEQEFWGGLFVRYKYFPWNDYVKTTFAISTGLNYATGSPPYEIKTTETKHGIRTLHYFSPEITFALPSYPKWELVLRLHHRSGFKFIACVHAFKCAGAGVQETVAGLRYKF